VLLQSSLDKSICYIETKSLDGETNLKHKIAPPSIDEAYGSDKDLIESINEKIVC